jgi:DNA (cytosine-5)-methyltransferase 1
MTTTAIDLFAGAGGFTTGAQVAGATVLWAANHWDEAVRLHALNHPEVEHVQQDLSEADWTAVPDCDIALASPACQGFSQAGQPARAGTGGSHRPNPATLKAKTQRDRNTAYAVLAMADTVRPESIVVENVTDFLRWSAFDAWLSMMVAFGYSTEVHVLNGKDFGGGQDRPRAVITARLGGRGLKLEVPNLKPKTIGECLDADDHPANRWNPIDSKPGRMQPLIAKAKRGAGSRCFWANVSESRGRTLDEVFPTSTTQSGTQWCLIDDDRIRVLNPREIARSMGFPETYELPKNRGLAGKLIGNAIDVTLSTAVVEQVMAK